MTAPHVMRPLCGYFTASVAYGPDIVTNDGHEAGDGPLFFYVPLPNGDAVMVPVCESHAEVLATVFAGSET